MELCYRGGWNCDGRKGPGGCRGTGGGSGVRHRCDDCDFDLCLSCWDAGNESLLTSGMKVKLRVGDSEAGWTGCPGTHLSFNSGYEVTVSEINGMFFSSTEFSTLWAPISATDAVISMARSFKRHESMGLTSLFCVCGA